MGGLKSSMQKKRLVLWLVIAVISLCTVLYFYRPLRYYIPFYKNFRKIAILIFRNPFCSFSEAEQGLLIKPCINKNTKLLSDRNRLVNVDSKGFQLWETLKGTFWIPPRFDLYTLTETLAEQECKIYGSGKVGVRSGDVVLDCGANIGIYTRQALNAGAKLVVAIEPSPENIECLHRNLKTEIKLGRVMICEKGVWNREDVLVFYTSKTSDTSKTSVSDSFVFSDKNSQKITVPVTTIDKIVKDLKLDRVDFIKMDVEGSEQNAIIGAKETIGKYGPRIAVAIEYLPDREKQISRISSMVKGFYQKYQTHCGDCGITREGRLNPQVIFFY